MSAAMPEFLVRYRRLVATLPDSDERAALSKCFCLVTDEGPIEGTLCQTLANARQLRADRVANQEAFPSERPMVIWAASAYFYGRVRETES